MTSPNNVLDAVQKEVDRLQEMITVTKTLIPNGNVNFVIYEAAIANAKEAIVEQDAVALCRMLPNLKGMS